jgi:hypothetical protein
LASQRKAERGTAAPTRSARDDLQPTGRVVGRAAEWVFAGWRIVEGNDPGSTRRDERRPAQLTGALEVTPGNAIERGTLENDGMRAAVARSEANHIALPRLHRGRLELTFTPSRNIDLLQ